MKKRSTILLNQLGKAAVKNLTSIIAETLVPDYEIPVAKIFTAADLWNIHNRKKAITQRRFIF